MKLKRVQKTEEKAAQGSDSGFDDPFFQHSVTTATAVSDMLAELGITANQCPTIFPEIDHQNV